MKRSDHALYRTYKDVAINLLEKTVFTCHTISADGIHSFVAGFPLQDAW